MVTRRRRRVDDKDAAKVQKVARPVYYPSSDGKPMAESDLQRDEMTRLIETLQDAFASEQDVYVSGNLLLYYEEGNPRTSVAPDVLVTRGIPKLPLREIYKLWEEGQSPNIVIEVTSRTTRGEDLRKKWELYATLGVREYVLYDPLGEYLQHPLQGHRLEETRYSPMPLADDGALLSEQLEMRLILEEGRLQLYDRRSGVRLLSPRERVAVLQAANAVEAEARRAAEPHAAAEAEARGAAERRIAELEALLRDRLTTEE